MTLRPIGHWPFGVATQKVSKTLIIPLLDLIITDELTDGPMDNGRMDKASYRVARLQLKNITPLHTTQLMTHRLTNSPTWRWPCLQPMIEVKFPIPQGKEESELVNGAVKRA